MENEVSTAQITLQNMYTDYPKPVSKCVDHHGVCATLSQELFLSYMEILKVLHIVPIALAGL